MNLLGSQPLKGNLAESLTADMPKGASSKQASPSGNVVLSPPSDKDASVARGPSEFQSFLAADEARFRSPAAKPTKKVAPEASVALGVDSARLASAFAAFAVHATAASYAGPTADVEQGNALPSQSTELTDDATQRPLQRDGCFDRRGRAFDPSNRLGIQCSRSSCSGAGGPARCSIGCTRIRERGRGRPYGDGAAGEGR
jgi:hypothetical protein